MVTNNMLFSRFGRQYPAGMMVFPEGDRGTEMYVIQSGKVKISKKCGETERVLSTLTAGEVFGEMALVNRQPRSATATVIEEAKLLIIDPGTFEAMLTGSIEISIRIMRMLIKRLREAHEQIECLLMSDLQDRVIHYLSCHAARVQRESTGPGHLLDLLPEEMASQLGVTPGLVAEVLNELAEQQLLQPQTDGIHVPDLKKLREYTSSRVQKETFSDD